MIYNLAPVDTIEVDAAGAPLGATTVPLANPLTVELPVGVILYYGPSKFVRIAGTLPAKVGESELTTESLVTALDGGDVASYGAPVGSSLLPSDWNKLSIERRTDLQELAEDLLELTAPAYTGRKGQAITRAVVLQILLQLSQSIDSQVVKSSTESVPGFTTAFRDRVIHPASALIVYRETGKKLAGFSVTAPGV